MPRTKRTRTTLRVGAAMVDITPPLGTQIAGDIGRYRPTEQIRDPLYARALVLDGGGKRVCWLSLDLLIVSRKWANKIKNAAARYGLDPDAVMVHGTQTHAAPSLGHFFVFDEDEWGVFPKKYPWLLGGDDRYNPIALKGAVEAIKRAVKSLQPVTVEVGRGMDGRVAFNRRFVMRDGTVRTHPPLCSPDILHCEGPIDPEVGVMTFKAKDGRAIAAVLHHSCHPVHGYPLRWISAGWPGAWCDEVRGQLGRDCVTMVVNGFCGNLHHNNHLDPNYRGDYHEMGRKLAETTAAVLKRMTPIKSPVLDWRARSLMIPLRSPTDEEVRESRALIKKHPQPIWKKGAEKTAVEWDWVYAATRIDLADHVKKTPLFDCPIQVFRLGSMALVSVPGEPFVEEQLRIKQLSPAPFTFTAHMSNTYVGYIPTPRAFKGGGYETRTGAGSKLCIDALGMIGDASLDMLKTLFKP